MGSEEIQKDEDSHGLLKTIAKVAFSHIGLCMIVIMYCVLGGFLFELLEKENEISACIESRGEYDDMENETLFSLLDIVMTNPLLSDASNAQLLGVFESFRNNSVSINYDGSWCEGYGLDDGPMHEWTFPGALFFSMTVITTIGYGHIAPKTVWGRILCISYAMMGIPLMLMFLANIGEVLANVFRYIYAKIICCGCCKSKKKRRALGGIDNPAHEPDEIGKLVSTRASLFMQREPGSNSEARHRGTINMSQEPDMSRGTTPLSSSRIRIETSAAPLQTHMSSRSSTQSSMGSNTSTDALHKSSSSPVNIKQLGKSEMADRGKFMKWRSQNSQSEPLVLDEVDDEDIDEEWEELSKVSVPLTVSLGILSLYIIGGAVLFKYWEDWDMLQSSYFCFITLSTIGFGDITPGRDFKDPMANARLIIGTIYAVFGMAILSMCFTLMQEEMIEKFRWLGRKFGVMEDDFDEDDLDDIATDEVFNSNRNRNQSDC